jgi:hypothetical protein
MDPLENKDEIISLFKYLKDLVRNPVESIKQIPSIKFSSLLIFQFFLCAFSVVLSNLLAPYAINIGQVIITIVASFIGLSLTSLFFYYFFLILFGRELSFRSLFTLVLFAHIPFALFHLLYYYFPVADLMGMGFSAILMIVGLVENYNIPRKAATRLLSSLYAMFFLFWIFKTISVYNVSEHSKPQNLDAIEREVQSDL